ncbi:hypothetical protein AQUCO_07600113v1 [Aquilegia coerulea]|uniref:Protein BIG GRAIN 1-like A n=1 Tax=Aquilegia coerulea TaxID=218851 RepID=A0A2G5C8X4_AQUCA|nr:hypothetical protein AQUCO_07600113v1 [Aquilegia coerulea]
MDQWTKSLREDKVRTRSRNPSFSSSLLDAIYRSIDEGEEDLVLYKETMKKKQTTSTTTTNSLKRDEKNIDDFTRACLIEKWMEKKVSEKVVVKRQSVRDFDQKLQNNRSSSTAFHSASSSSDSSSAGGFSSSEAESLYGSRIQRPKPIRTSVSAKPESFEKPLQYEQRKSTNIYESHYHHQHERISSVPQKVKQEGGFNKTKSKAMKIYGDLKKVKQPISPGGRLATFLNSLFTAGNTKKAKLSNSVNGIEDLRSERKSKSTQTSTCSSASSFSRSCLSKTPSSRGAKSTNGTKRSVRFYPVSVIVDEDSRPCGQKSIYEQQQQQQQSKVVSMNEEFKYHLMEKNRKIEEAAREFLKSYQDKNLEKKKCDYEMRDVHQDYEDDDDEDAESYASSDLFELDNFASIGNERYREELPVYETTHLEKNRPISNAYIL